MPRTPIIRYFDCRKASHTKYQGKQRLLAACPNDEPDSPIYRKAVEQFARIMHADEVECAEDNSLVSAIIVRYFHALDVPCESFRGAISSGDQAAEQARSSTSAKRTSGDQREEKAKKGKRRKTP